MLILFLLKIRLNILYLLLGFNEMATIMSTFYHNTNSTVNLIFDLFRIELLNDGHILPTQYSPDYYFFRQYIIISFFRYHTKKTFFDHSIVKFCKSNSEYIIIQSFYQNTICINIH